MVDFDHQEMDSPRLSTQNLEVLTRTERVDVAELMVGALLGYQGSYFDDDDFGPHFDDDDDFGRPSKMANFDHQSMDPTRLLMQNPKVITQRVRVDVAEMATGVVLGQQLQQMLSLSSSSSRQKRRERELSGPICLMEGGS